MGTFTPRAFRAPMRDVSYLFTAYIFDKHRFSVQFLTDYWASIEPCIPGERLIHVAVSPRVDAVFYFGGESFGKLIEFGYGCEALIRDGHAEGPARELIATGQTDFQYAAWAASETSEFDVSYCFTGDGYQARAIIRSDAERITIENNLTTHHEMVKLAQSPQELGMVTDDASTFDEEEYQRQLTEREEPFRPGLLVHDEIGVPRGKIMDARAHAQSGKGKLIWPPGGPVDTADLRRATLAMATPQLPALPLWAHFASESNPGPSGRTVMPRRRRKT